MISMQRQCPECAHFLIPIPGESADDTEKRIRKTGARYCIAFPDGIPAKVYEGLIIHDTVMPNQSGDAVFTPIDGAE